MLSQQHLVFLLGCSDSIQFLIPFFSFHAAYCHPLLICEPVPRLQFRPIFPLLKTVSETTIGTLLLPVQYLCYLHDAMMQQW